MHVPLGGIKAYSKLVRSGAQFVEPMLVLCKDQLPNDPNRLLELKLDEAEVAYYRPRVSSVA